jgi:hypothetical protein
VDVPQELIVSSHAFSYHSRLWIRSSKPRDHVEENQDPLPQKNGREHFLHLLNGENVGKGDGVGHSLNRPNAIMLTQDDRSLLRRQ